MCTPICPFAPAAASSALPVKLGEQYEEKERYLAAFEKEMDIYLRVLGLEKFRHAPYWSAAAPVFLTPEQLKRYLEYFCRRMDMSKCRQFNYDVTPTRCVVRMGWSD